MLRRSCAFLILSLAVPLAGAQAPASPLDPLVRRPGELTEGQAIDRSQAFLARIGEPPMDRRACHAFLTFGNFQTWPRVFDVNDGPHRFYVDAITGRIDFYSLSSSVFLKGSARALSATAPTPTQAETIVTRVASAVGLPPGAKRTRFVVQDRNPKPDADMRGYVSAIYEGRDRSRLHLVFDRKSGRLENLIRTHPHRASAGGPATGPGAVRP